MSSQFVLMQPLLYPAALAAMYNASYCLTELEEAGEVSPLCLTIGEAEALLYKKYGYVPNSAATISIDVLFGRPIYVGLTYDGLDPTEYDRFNGGPGTLLKVIRSVVNSSNVLSPYILSRHQLNVMEHYSRDEGRAPTALT